MSLLVKEILEVGKRQLETAGVSDALIDSKLLYCFMMDITRTQLILEYQKELPDSLCDKYFKLLDERASGVPLQYITGSQEFMGLEFKVNENVLIPRQDTETVVEDAMDIIRNNKLRNETFAPKAKKDFDVLDLCCGSGAIGVSIAALCSNTKVTCSDVSKEAIEIAKENAAANGVSRKVSFVQGNLFAPFKGKLRNRKFDMIISNPPYIRTDVIGTLQREVKDHEPMRALDGGPDGLFFYRKIVEEAPLFLKKDGIIVFETGHDQREDICNMMEESGSFAKVEAYKDLAGRDRVIAGLLAGKHK